MTLLAAKPFFGVLVSTGGQIANGDLRPARVGERQKSPTLGFLGSLLMATLELLLLLRRAEFWIALALCVHRCTMLCSFCTGMMGESSCSARTPLPRLVVSVVVHVSVTTIVSLS